MSPEAAAMELDCRAMLCPMPIIELAKHISDVEVGQIIGVVATDAAARVDIAAWCRMRGHELVAADACDPADDDSVRYLVRRLS